MLCSETATAVKGKSFSSCTRTSKPVARPEPLGLHNHQVVNSRNRCCVSLEKFSLKDVGHNQGQRSRRTPSYPGSLSSRPPRLIKHIDLIVIVIFFFPPREEIPLHLLRHTVLLPFIRTPHTPAASPPDRPQPPLSRTRPLSIPVQWPDSSHPPKAACPPGRAAPSASLSHQEKIKLIKIKELKN